MCRGFLFFGRKILNGRAARRTAAEDVEKNLKPRRGLRKRLGAKDSIVPRSGERSVPTLRVSIWGWRLSSLWIFFILVNMRF
jgi:hypothetical protein